MPTIKTNPDEKIIIHFYLLIWTFYSFGQTDKNTSSSINSFKEIKLTHTDDKCGEWGGNSETILVFRKEFRGKLYIEYRKQVMDCNEDPITHYHRKDYDEKKMILSTNEEMKLVELCIKELIVMKLSNPVIITHSGIVNEVISSDSTLVIRDYPSKEWLAFNRLKKRILEK